MRREIRGYHVALIFGSAFAIIIGVNLVLAVQAIRTFPGLEVKNSYIASQTFDRDRAAQEALGWTARAQIDGGLLRLELRAKDGPAPARIIAARLGRATSAAEDVTLQLRRDGGVWLADLPALGPGSWDLWLTAEAEDGTAFRQRLDLWVRE